LLHPTASSVGAPSLCASTATSWEQLLPH
jgi:hypothetical protein